MLLHMFSRVGEKSASMPMPRKGPRGEKSISDAQNLHKFGSRFTCNIVRYIVCFAGSYRHDLECCHLRLKDWDSLSEHVQALVELADIVQTCDAGKLRLAVLFWAVWRLLAIGY